MEDRNFMDVLRIIMYSIEDEVETEDDDVRSLKSELEKLEVLSHIIAPEIASENWKSLFEIITTHILPNEPLENWEWHVLSLFSNHSIEYLQTVSGYGRLPVKCIIKMTSDEVTESGHPAYYASLQQIVRKNNLPESDCILGKSMIHSVWNMDSQGKKVTDEYLSRYKYYIVSPDSSPEELTSVAEVRRAINLCKFMDTNLTDYTHKEEI